jgi:hypothetical protein
MRREKLLSKAVIYDLTLVDLVERHDLEANGNYYKQVWTKPSKKEYEHAVNDLDEFVFSVKMWQGTFRKKPATQQEEEPKIQEIKDGEEEMKQPVKEPEPEPTYLTQYTQKTSREGLKSTTLRRLTETMKRNEVSQF